MKKNILKVAFVAAFALVAGYGVYTSQIENKLSDLVLDNVEALAGCESSTSSTGYRTYQAENGCHCLFCPDGDTNCKCSSKG